MAQIRLEPPPPLDFTEADAWPRWKKRFEQFRVASGLCNEDESRQVSTLLYCLGEGAEEVLQATATSLEKAKKQYHKVTVWFLPDGHLPLYLIVVVMFFVQCDFTANFVEVERFILYAGWLTISILERSFDLQQTFTTTAARNGCLVHTRSPAGLTLKVACLTAIIRNQLEGEPVEQYVLSLHSLARNCEYGTLQEELIRDRIVIGIRDKALSRRLQLDADLTLEKAMRLVRQNEAVGEQQKVLQGNLEYKKESLVRQNETVGGQQKESAESVDLDKVGVSSKHRGGEKRKCSRCGREHGANGRCPAQNAVCFGCKRKGHFRSMCRSNSISEMTPDTEEAESCEVAVYLGTIEGERQPSWLVNICVGPSELTFKLDTGAEVTAISENAFRELKGVQYEAPAKKLYGPSHEPLSVVGQFIAEFKYKGKALNESVLREVYPLPTVDETLAQLTGATVFSKLDANSGFWQIPLADSSRLLTTFITPFGRYCFNKLPFGISSAPELFQKRMGQILEGLDGVLCQMDDVLVFGSNQQEHDFRLHAVFKAIKAAGVTLNSEKCSFSVDKLKFFGHVISRDGVSADPDKTKAILQN
eukprot:Em0013g66a